MKKKKHLLKLLLINALIGNTLSSQEIKKDSIIKKETKDLKTENHNVMLNAANDSGPRNINIGLPASVGGTTILENGLPVVYNWFTQGGTTVWRKDSSLNKFETLNISQTGVMIGDVGVSVSTYSNKGTEKFQGSAAFNTNHFGLLRGDVNVSGPIKNGFYYSISTFVNLDPGTFDPGFTSYLDNTKIIKAVINKKYNNGKGEIGIQYKFADYKGASIKQSPYIYHQNGTVDALPYFRIGLDSYFERTGKATVIDPLTGQKKRWDAMNNMGSTSHVIDVFGKNKLSNGFNFNYVTRFHFADAGLFNPYATSIENLDKTKRKYIYTDDGSEYKGQYVQSILMLAAPKVPVTNIMSKIELSKKIENHSLMAGLNGFYSSVDKSNTATYTYYTEIANQPRQLARQKLENGKLINDGDLNGNRNYNAAMQYYDGKDSKLAFYAMDKWNINQIFTLDLGARFELQMIDGFWYPKHLREKDKSGWVSQAPEKIKDDWFHKTFTGNLLIKAFPNSGFLIDANYIELSGNLSSYAGDDNPLVERQQTTGLAGGFYYNSKLVNLISKVTSIKRTNFKNNSTFTDPNNSSINAKQTITYDVETIGWTTDAVFNPFKGFNLHLLLTLQNPKYDNFVIPIFNTEYNFSGNPARSVSKMLIEIDPSYTYKNFKFWASARYFSKESANYPGTLYFAPRWETFAGINFKPNKKIDININVVNLLNQSGAQGSISGANLTSAQEAQTNYYENPVTGTYIRPFTVEAGIKYKF